MQAADSADAAARFEAFQLPYAHNLAICLVIIIQEVREKQGLGPGVPVEQQTMQTIWSNFETTEELREMPYIIK